MAANGWQAVPSAALSCCRPFCAMRVDAFQHMRMQRYRGLASSSGFRRCSKQPDSFRTCAALRQTARSCPKEL
eukprot:8757902-Alexandrium_andersonii.AAC.1